jgi:purine-nucleoside phosphorylase
MKTELLEIEDSADHIRSVIKEKPDIAVIFGSGLGILADQMENSIAIPYESIPGFPVPSAPGHEGKLIYGSLAGKMILAMKGRPHYYEGHDMSKVIFPVRVLKLLGIDDILITNAAGGINTDLRPGDLMLVTDHIGYSCPSPLRGINIEELGVRFPDMSSCYNKELMNMAKRCADELGIDIKTGVYAFSQGPMFETPAEIRGLRIMGADAVGMSTVPEAIAANHMKMRILAISCITNMAAGILEQPLTHQEVLETALSVEKPFSMLINKIIGEWRT